jgi:hypothetical protein
MDEINYDCHQYPHKMSRPDVKSNLKSSSAQESFACAANRLLG